MEGEMRKLAVAVFLALVLCGCGAGRWEKEVFASDSDSVDPYILAAIAMAERGTYLQNESLRRNMVCFDASRTPPWRFRYCLFEGRGYWGGYMYMEDDEKGCRRIGFFGYPEQYVGSVQRYLGRSGIGSTIEPVEGKNNHILTTCFQ